MMEKKLAFVLVAMLVSAGLLIVVGNAVADTGTFAKVAHEEKWNNRADNRVLFSVSLSSTTIYVPDNYVTIQDAVNAASEGDTIIVRDGTYTKNINVDKRLTIKSENGPTNCIVQVERYKHVFEVTADYVNIIGFTVKGAAGWGSAGIYLKANHCNISDNICENNSLGMYICDSNNNTIKGNICSYNGGGMYIYDSNNNTIKGNICSYDGKTGIYLYNSNNNTIKDNICSFNWGGICLWDSSNNTIKDNNICSHSRNAINLLRYSKNNKLTGNTMIDNGISIGGYSIDHYMHEIDESNTVNGKPVYYWTDVEGGRVSEDAGQVILVNCRDVLVENQNIRNASVGIKVAFSSNITIRNNDCKNNKGGISLSGSNNTIEKNNCSYNGDGISLSGSNNTIEKNNCSYNGDGISLSGSNNTVEKNNCSYNGDGISLSGSNNTVEKNNCSYNGDGISLSGSNNTVEKNNCSYNGDGISLRWHSNNNTIENNICSYNDNGIYLRWDSNNTIEKNNCSYNGDGIYLEYSKNNKLTGNIMIDNGIFIWGASISDYTHEIDESNTVNGKPVYYQKEVKGGRVPEAAGQVILANCREVLVENQNIRNASVGIKVAFSSNITIRNNICENNKDGICLWRSNSNTIEKNNCSYNGDGISLSGSNSNTIKNNICSYNAYDLFYIWCSDNIIYLNNFINNTENVYSSYRLYNPWNNIGNSTSKITYTYKGTQYTNYLGNYWDDYTDSDINSDGIWDNPLNICPRNIYPDWDYHPLVEPFGTYITPPSPEKLLNVPFFSQRDPTWKAKNLDHSPYSIGGYGCALTSVAMLSNYFGHDTDPDRLNTSLTEVGGLDIHGILHWNKLEQVTSGKLKWIGWSSANWETIDHELSKRNPVIANVSYPTTGYPHHFIVFIGKIGDKYYFLDPYDEQKQIREWPNGKLGTYTLNNLRIYHGTSSITITAYCPVDIVVTDPDNLSISKQSNDIPGASYTEEDMNGDGDPDDVIFIPYRKTGEYMISVVKEAEAAPDDKYTLVVSTESGNTTLAEDVSVGEVPTESYEFESTFYFDTGSSNKPYPSISGTHNGTIKLNQMMTVQKLYTYSCAGTGGHTEYVRLWNSTLNVTATWNGYTEDWHNLSFKEPFTLVAGEEYNYSIRTGSYPQIHHESELPTANGWINCSQFTDANGKKHDNWIPAIKLEGDKKY